MTVEWVWRSREPAKSPPDPNYPHGITVDVAGPNRAACDVTLPYPAPGVGSWLVVCEVCDFRVLVTAAGRADDPTKVRLPCAAMKGLGQ